MPDPVARTTSDTARLMGGAPGFAVGWQQPIYLPNPAAGAVWSRKVDGRFLERVLAVTFTLTTSAVVANRFPAVQLADSNGKVITAVPAGGAVAASQSLFVNLAVNGPAYSFGNSGGTYGFLPDLLVPADWSWSAAVAGLDVADTLTNIVLLVQQFPNDAAAISAVQ